MRCRPMPACRDHNTQGHPDQLASAIARQRTGTDRWYQLMCTWRRTSCKMRGLPINGMLHAGDLPPCPCALCRVVRPMHRAACRCCMQHLPSHFRMAACRASPNAQSTAHAMVQVVQRWRAEPEKSTKTCSQQSGQTCSQQSGRGSSPGMAHISSSRTEWTPLQ